MIIKAKTRGDAVALGRYLLDSGRNEHIEVHSVEGFLSDDVMGAMRETEAISFGVKSRKYLFSVSLSPPPTEQVKTAVFDDAIRQIKERVGLAEQPHIALFHENEGRRHMHLVISRIDAETMTVRELPYFKTRLRDVSKGIFIEQGWDMPRGFVDKADRDPRNFDLAEYQQAKRIGRDKRHLKELAQDAWTISDNPQAFERALEARGLYLARGDRRSHVVMTWQGEVFSLPKMLSRKTKEVRERLGSADDLRDLETTRQHVRDTVEPMLRRLTGEAEATNAREMQSLDVRRDNLTEAHTAERERLDAAIRSRQGEELRARSERLRTGIRGLWDRLRGERKRIEQQNDMQALLAMRRDRGRRDELVLAQLQERRSLQEEINAVRQRHEQRLDTLHRDLAGYDEPQRHHEADHAMQPASQRPADQFAAAAPQHAEEREADQRETSHRPQQLREREQRRKARQDRQAEQSRQRPDFGLDL